MTCRACGYSTELRTDKESEIWPDKAFLVWPVSLPQGVCTVNLGDPINFFACPVCGTVRVEVGL